MGRPDVIAPDCCNLQIRGLNIVGDKSDIGTDSASFLFFYPSLGNGCLSSAVCGVPRGYIQRKEEKHQLQV